jgi:hypothetical protein
MLLSRLKILEEDRSLAPFLAMIQSSGYGKTRTILEVVWTIWPDGKYVPSRFRLLRCDHFAK